MLEISGRLQQLVKQAKASKTAPSKAKAEGAA